MSVNLQRALTYVRNWNTNFPVGTEVEYQGKLAKTWSPAGLGEKSKPSVWLCGVEELVALDSLTVPGWKKVRA